MKVLITGAKGFIGQNLIAELKNQGFTDLLLFDLDTPADLLQEYASTCEFVFHLAGVNRPENPEEFMSGNYGFTQQLLDSLKKAGNKAPVMITSSTQAKLDNAYGKSKKAGEDLMFAYGAETKAPVYVYRLPNVFGKWCRPNYNSAVATFCHNTTRGLPLQINDPDADMRLVYIDDVVSSFINLIKNTSSIPSGFQDVEPVHEAKLGRIVELLQSFVTSRETLLVPDMSDAFTRKLYSTWLSYLPTDTFDYNLTMHTDHRGSFTEFLKTHDRGQVSVNISKPGITKGNHWHHSKNEKFLVVSGSAAIRFRKPDSQEIIEYHVSGEKLTVIDIPCGYTHHIQNDGNTDLVTVMWVNEIFDINKPDTYFEEV